MRSFRLAALLGVLVLPASVLAADYQALRAANPSIDRAVAAMPSSAINGDLMSRRATITATGTRGKNHVIDAEAPLASMFGYTTQVRSLSQGRASYSMEPLRYEAMPAGEANRVLGVF